jgi:hypothetical protein
VRCPCHQADADAATDINDLDRLLPALYTVAGVKQGEDSGVANRLGFVAGSRYAKVFVTCCQRWRLLTVCRCSFFRAHLAKDSIATRAFYRTVLMKGFHWYVQLMVTPNVQDTQCGFKLFTRRAAKSLFGSLHLYRWAFDTELIYLAERLHIPIAEVDMVTRLMYI